VAKRKKKPVNKKTLDEAMQKPKDELKKISACLILKNEGTTIYKCLDSIKDFVDEYIIGIDESTDDNTLAEILKFGVDNGYIKKGTELGEKNKEYYASEKLIWYSYKWKNNFSKARNEGMDKATGDYILIMDGHEYFPNQWFNITEQKMTPVKQLLQKVKERISKEEIDEAHFQLYQQPFLGMTPNNFFLQPRIYRNAPKIRFNRPAHNTITSTNQEKVIHFVDIILIHDAPEDNRSVRKKQRVVMNIDKILAAIKKNPKDTRSYFYLGNTYIENKDYKKAIDSYKKYIKYSKIETHEKYQVYVHMATAYRNLKKHQEARDALYMAKSIDPMRRDAYALLGELFLELKKYDNCIFELSNMLKLHPKASRMFQNGGVQTWDPHQKLAIAYAATDNMPKAIAHLEHAYKILPNNKWLETLAKWKEDKRHILIIDKMQNFTNDFVEYLKSNNNYVVVFSPNYDIRLAKWADDIWCEWADENAILCSNNFPEKTVVRLHGYESYLLMGYWNQINWNGLKKIVFVADHIKKRMIEKAKLPEDKCVVIHNGVNVDKFYIKNKKRNKMKVGYAGFVNSKKNPFLLLQIIKNNPEISFNLRVDFQDEFWRATYEHELKDCKNVIYHGRYNNLNDFWNKMNGVLCTSIIESFSYNIAEAMACGCVPFVYNFNGAKAFWSNWIYNGNGQPDFKLLESNDLDNMNKNRQYIIDNFNYKDRMRDMEQVLIQEIKKKEIT
jgi:glycosyltransferase involved in cell wall biosynthesis